MFVRLQSKLIYGLFQQSLLKYFHCVKNDLSFEVYFIQIRRTESAKIRNDSVIALVCNQKLKAGINSFRNSSRIY